MATGRYGYFLVLLVCWQVPLQADTALDDPLLLDEALIVEEKRSVQLSAIDSENFEIAVSGGVLSLEDFETNAVIAASLTFHITEDFFLVGRYGQSSIGETSFERLSGAASLLPEDGRDFTFYDLSLGINLFPGEAFLLSRWAVGTSFYLVAGAGSNDFAGDDRPTVNLGMGYRLLANDTFAFHAEVRDHLFETELTGTTKDTHNIELSLGFSVFF